MFSRTRKNEFQHTLSHSPEFHLEEYQVFYPIDLELETMGQRQYDDQCQAPKAPKLNANSTSFLGYAYSHLRYNSFEVIADVSSKELDDHHKQLKDFYNELVIINA